MKRTPVAPTLYRPYKFKGSFPSLVTSACMPNTAVCFSYDLSDAADHAKVTCYAGLDTAAIIGRNKGATPQPSHSACNGLLWEVI